MNRHVGDEFSHKLTRIMRRNELRRKPATQIVSFDCYKIKMSPFSLQRYSLRLREICLNLSKEYTKLWKEYNIRLSQATQNIGFLPSQLRLNES